MMCQLWMQWRFGLAMGLRSLTTACKFCVISPIATSSTRCHMSNVPSSLLESTSPCVKGPAPARLYANGRHKQPILYMFTKEECSLCADAKEKLAPFLHRLKLEEIDITQPENQLWKEKYQNDIPVFHLHEDFVFHHRVKHDVLERALQRYEQQDDHTHATASKPLTPYTWQHSAILPADTTEIYFDLETTGLERTCHITQLAAVRGEEQFSCYVMPKIPISHGAAKLTGLVVHNHKLLHHGKEVDAVGINKAFTLFFDFLSKTKNNVLIGHNIHTFDCPIMLNALTGCDKVSKLTENVTGYLDTLKLFRLTHPALASHTQVSLIRSLVDVEYEAHKALEDVIALQRLVGALDPGMEDLNTLKQKAMFCMKDAIAAHSKSKAKKLQKPAGDKPARQASRRQAACEKSEEK